MPKVLEKGKANGHVIIGVYNCNGHGNGNHGCGAKLEVYLDDLFETSHTDYSGDTTYYTTYECPECGICNDISYNGSFILPKRHELKLYNTKKMCLDKIQKMCQDDINKWQELMDQMDQMD